jgi:3'-5' exoribonuclease
MMPVMTEERRAVADLSAGDTFDQVFLIRNRELRHTATGSSYVACVLVDRSGSAEARWWKATERTVAETPDRGFVRVKGRAQSYRGQLQLIIEQLDAADEASIDVADIIPRADHDVEEMFSDLLALLDDIQNGALRDLVTAFIEDDALMERFKRAPAGAQLHHAYVGGLLEHTLSITRLCRAAAVVYGDKINRDLLLAGAFLHDIGKLEELTVDGSYTDRGNLIGHIALGVVWVQEKAAKVAAQRGAPFPEQVVTLVQHMIVSHHGSREKGSPRVPMIPEAFVLHALDDLDAKLDMAVGAIAGEQEASATFTRYNRPLDAKIYRNTRSLAE